MVTEFGMSERVGPLTVNEPGEVMLWGREVRPPRAVSPHMADLVDDEVRRLVRDALERARRLLSANRSALDALAAALLERETLDRTEVEQIVAGARSPVLPRPAGPQAIEAVLVRGGHDE
jgi:cell division protease FtsH